MRAENIIVATDFSPSSEAALTMASSLARDSGATLHIAHVKEPFVAYHLSRRYGDVPPYPELDTLRGVLKRVVPTYQSVPCRHWLLTGEDISGLLLELADELAADLIVVGTHGRSGVSRLLVGSVAERMLRSARCPVLIVKNLPAEMLEPTAGVLPS